MSTYPFSVVPQVSRPPSLIRYSHWVFSLLGVLFFLQSVPVADLWARETHPKPQTRFSFARDSPQRRRLETGGFRLRRRRTSRC